MEYEDRIVAKNNTPLRQVLVMDNKARYNDTVLACFAGIFTREYSIVWN